MCLLAGSTAMCSCVTSTRALSPAWLPRLLLSQTRCTLSLRSLWTSPRCMAVSRDPQRLPLPSQARVVICGGGIVGTSVAYHLAKLGWTDIVLLEQGRWDTYRVYSRQKWCMICLRLVHLVVFCCKISPSLSADLGQEQPGCVLALSVWPSLYPLSVRWPTTLILFTSSWSRRRESKQVLWLPTVYWSQCCSRAHFNSLNISLCGAWSTFLISWCSV